MATGTTQFPPLSYSSSLLLLRGSKETGGKSGVEVWRGRHLLKGRSHQEQQVQDQQSQQEHQNRGDCSILERLAWRALELSGPASEVVLKSGSASDWFQLAGHPDSFAPAGPGRIWKKVRDATECNAYRYLSTDPQIRDLVPRYCGTVDYKGNTFIELQDLLYGFHDPYVIDLKMGTRTFLESEVDNPVARADLYKKMVAQAPHIPTAEEHQAQAVTKVRYMQFREQQSSSHFLGFRVDGIKKRGTPPHADLSKVTGRSQVEETMRSFLGGRRDVQIRLVKRLKEMRSCIEKSEFFQTHEVIGSSIFMLYDNQHVGAWLIDFAKTVPVAGRRLDHRSRWKPGNHEEGFLFGLDNLIEIVEGCFSAVSKDCS